MSVGSPPPGGAMTPGPDASTRERAGEPWEARFAAPLRAVDRVETATMTPAIKFHAYKEVNPRDPYMGGHFPGLTLLPATFFIEALRQSMNTVLGRTEPVNVLRIVTGRWLAPVLSGDELCMEVEAVPEGPDRWAVRAHGIRRDGTTVSMVKAVVGTERRSNPLDVDRHPPAVTDRAGIPNYADMLEILPVAHPIVLVDRVEAIEPGRRIVVSKAVTGSEPCYRSMPPGLPVSRYTYPHSLTLESFGQAASLLWLSDVSADGVRMAASVRDCRFAGQVYPGAVLRHVVRIDRLISDDVFVSGQSWDGDRCVLTVGMMATVTRPSITVLGTASAPPSALRTRTAESGSTRTATRPGRMTGGP
ncbi:hypothetical protein FNQ90_00805 [Streptomyces alkaliphilus]|uniref:Beta-hydroxyacyl-ACP dehydratase n=1 Tax=Streptomyces alkaliphilus TaxID=1472722 RepID=A0A7W3XZV2_9ACTN|nr:hypothetical protein [Streptomyces alkaliphilus]MBB0242682.1 hypothetical protein [Streptomyces alkaliphilus]